MKYHENRPSAQGSVSGWTQCHIKARTAPICFAHFLVRLRSQALPDVNAHSANDNADVVAAAAEDDMREHAQKSGKHRDLKASSTHDRPGMKTVFPDLASFDPKSLLSQLDMANQLPAEEALVMSSPSRGQLRNLDHHHRQLVCNVGDMQIDA